MVEDQEDMEFISLHKCIKNTSTSVTVLTELNTSRGSWTPKVQERSPYNQVG